MSLFVARSSTLPSSVWSYMLEQDEIWNQTQSLIRSVLYSIASRQTQHCQILIKKKSLVL